MKRSGARRQLQRIAVHLQLSLRKCAQPIATSRHRRDDLSSYLMPPVRAQVDIVAVIVNLPAVSRSGARWYGPLSPRDSVSKPRRCYAPCHESCRAASPCRVRQPSRSAPRHPAVYQAPRSIYAETLSISPGRGKTTSATLRSDRLPFATIRYQVWPYGRLRGQSRSMRNRTPSCASGFSYTRFN